LLYAFSKSHLERLSALGTGLLLGVALGVIIPEGIEAIEAAHTDGPPTGRIALCLVVGFTLMLIIEQLISPHSHSHPPVDSFSSIPNSTSEVEFDAELGDIGLENSADRRHDPPLTPNALESSVDRKRAFVLLLGLAIHGIADGLALGVAHVAGSSTGNTNNTLSLVVFFALVLHKAPTTLAFTTSIISTNIPRSKCTQYLTIFSLSTPLSALMTYTVFSFVGIGDKGDLTGLALLVSGGTFVCRYCTPAIKTSFARAWRDASNHTRVYYCLRNVYSSWIQVIPSCPLNCAIEVIYTFKSYFACPLHLAKLKESTDHESIRTIDLTCEHGTFLYVATVL